MSGMSFAHLLPFYLDETDEQVIALNDALLKLEQDQSDGPALAVAFRIVHTIKGSSAALGFTEVNKLTHHLESFFDMLRSGQRQLDRDSLNLFFKCLDELRNYHQRLRETGEAAVDFSDLINQVIMQIRRVQNNETAPAQNENSITTDIQTASSLVVPEEQVTLGDHDNLYAIKVIFQEDISLPDMKARLIAKRLSSMGEITAADPPLEKLDEIADLRGITFRLSTESTLSDVNLAVDMSGVASIEITDLKKPASPASITSSQPDAMRIETADVKKEAASAPSAPADQPAIVATATANHEPVSTAAEATTSAPRPAEAKPPAPSDKPAQKSVGKVGETVRVELDRLDHLMNLTGELVLSKSRFVQVASALQESLGQRARRHISGNSQESIDLLQQSLAAVFSGESSLESFADVMDEHLRRLSDDFSSMAHELARTRSARQSIDDLNEAVHQLSRVCDGLQKGVLDTRMIPIGPLFERFRRVIRDLSHATGKEIRLKITGESTELDKRVIDELADPLVHMVRNAGDHGLESPDDREKAGKSRIGTISLGAAHSGDRVTITVSDDGRGINAERIRRKIVEKGLVDELAAARLTERELVSYIFHPGLSTAESVTDISGRGVGMDIVKSRIESLNGTIDIRTTQGQGTTFVIRLPLTLAILPSLLVRVHDEVYAIALDHIREIVEVRPEGLHQIRKRRVIEIRKKIVPVISLDDVFLWGNMPYPRAAAKPENQEENGNTTRIVILHSADEMIGLEVDHLMGLQEVVLKSLEKNLGPVEGLSGASILGDGRVSLILDVDRLIDRASQGILAAKSTVA
jgi:two-component system chemotaxis sensor kinase CheA